MATERRSSLKEVHDAIADGAGKSADVSKAPADLAIAQAKTQAAISGQGVVSVPTEKSPADFSKAQAMTQAAITGLGEPVYASMTDHKIVDAGLAKAMQDVAIQKGGIKSVDVAKAPADRAIQEALTMKAISTGKVSLKAGDLKEPKVDLVALQAQAQAEKDAKVAARTFGGGDAKATMPNILSEIEGQGGVISVPAGKAPADNVSLSHTKTLMEIDALKGEAIYASGTDGTVQDKALAQAKMLHQISHKGESSVNAEKVAKVEHRATSEALTLNAIGSAGKKQSLKKVDAPASGLTKEQLTALQEEAAAEKK